MLLEPAGQLPSDFLINSLSKLHGKCSWSLLASSPQISLLNPYMKSMEHVPEAEKPMILEPQGQKNNFLLRKTNDSA